MADSSKVGLRLETPRLTIVAGESGAQEITITNLSTLPDNFDLSVEGLPPEWVSFSSSSVNLFPNWSESVKFTVQTSEKIRPNVYAGRITATSRSQGGIKGQVKLEIEVLAPLKVDARLQPHRAKGYKANYNLILRNRSMTESLISLQMAPTTQFCNGIFSPVQVKLPAGKSEVVALKVQLRKKTPKEQVVQTQPFEVQIQPEWLIGPTTVNTPEVLVEGEYLHQSRWAFLGRHPVLYGFVFFLLVVILLWQVLILNTIQNTLLLSADRVVYTGTPNGALRVEQEAFNGTVNNAIPLSNLLNPKVEFLEETQQVQLSYRPFIFKMETKGFIAVDPQTHDLKYQPQEPAKAGDFPWFFAPPEKIAQKLNQKLRNWLGGLNPPQRLDKAEIEGNTLFLRLKVCSGSGNEPGCPPKK